jgi:rhomboid protease GluP
MLDGQVDYSVLRDEELLDVLRNIDAARFPLNYANLKVALTARGFAVAQAEGAPTRVSVEDPALTEGGIHRVEARFSPGRGLLAWLDPPRNDYRLVGAGLVFIGTHVVRVRARRLAFVIGLAFEQDLEFKKESITDVEHGGGMVRFVYREPGAKPRALSFWVQGGTTAEDVASRLPVARSAEFQPLLPSQIEFEAETHRRAPVTWVTLALVTLNLLAFVATLLGGAGLLKPSGSTYIEWGSNFGPYATSGDWWRLLTSNFLHLGLFHLLFNMWALAATGTLIERLLGSVRFAFVYVVAAIGSSFASLLWNPEVNSVGASGAIFGLYGVLLAVLRRGPRFVPGSIIVPMRNFTLIFVVVMLAAGLPTDGIDNAAHVGGLVAGFIVGLLIARPLSVTATRPRATDTVAFDDTTMFAVAAGVAALLLMAAMIATQQRARSLQGEALYYQTQRWLERAEAIAVERHEQIRQQLKADTLDDDTYADAIESSVLPTWVEAEKRLARVQMAAESPVHGRLQYLRAFAGSRRGAFELCVRAARLHDVEMGRACARQLEAGDQLVEEEKKRVSLSRPP